MTANSFFVFQSAVTVEGNLDAKPDTTMLYVSVKDETVKASFMRLMA